MSVTPIYPEVLWAQRSNEDIPEKNVIYLSILCQDTTEPKIELSATTLTFSASGDNEDLENPRPYAVTIEFFAEIDPDQSKYSVSGRGVTFVIRKKQPQAEFWPRLTKEKAKYHYIKTDFNKWVDEDEQEEEDEQPDQAAMGGMPGGMPGASGFDMSQLAGMGGMGGMPGMEGMGGMPGGMEGFDMSKLAQMAGMDGMDLSKLAGGAEGADDADEEDDEDDEDDEQLP
ncbi:HSP20-like chaperone [Nadsonia fulvescens var. elongata DSM 6958]|uniref:HSP20-like chaperone n=1 Tax=Nadsonia fulvescens var. elongata DSM 6958 TaxID=857566 RepID=A0A1E3PCR3_9ASCO|nr:HSP20-like chaperone [Nadsonia fulvescens var. elongata DSM 6958]